MIILVMNDVFVKYFYIFESVIGGVFVVNECVCKVVSFFFGLNCRGVVFLI